MTRIVQLRLVLTFLQIHTNFGFLFVLASFDDKVSGSGAQSLLDLTATLLHDPSFPIVRAQAVTKVTYEDHRHFTHASCYRHLDQLGDVPTLELPSTVDKPKEESQSGENDETYAAHIRSPWGSTVVEGCGRVCDEFVVTMSVLKDEVVRSK